jgi:ribose transport system substrate-binding protein
MKWVSILLVLAAILAAGCGDKGGGGDSSATKSGAKDFTITLIAKSTTNPVFLSAKTGAEAAAKEFGAANSLNIIIDWQTPEKEDGQIQAQNIAQAVTRHSDAILISCSDAQKVTGAINDAVAAGIPVMTFDSDAPDSKRFAFYGVDDVETGKKVMDELAKQVGGKGHVAILAGNQNAPNLQKRVQGVKDAAKAYPGITIVDVFNHPETPQDASSAVVQAMNAHPEIDSWAMVGGWPLFAKSLLTELPSRHAKVVAVDALPIELEYVEKGIAPALLAQPTFKWGYESVKIILDKVHNKKDVPVINKMELVPVTKETLGSWARQLKEWGFTDVDQKYLDLK